MNKSASIDPIKAMRDEHDAKKEAAERAVHQAIGDLEDGKAVDPKHLTRIANDAGLSPDQLEELRSKEKERRRLVALVATKEECLKERAALIERAGKLRTEKREVEKRQEQELRDFDHRIGEIQSSSSELSARLLAITDAEMKLANSPKRPESPPKSFAQKQKEATDKLLQERGEVLDKAADREHKIREEQLRSGRRG
ncbi:MAG TPA: hypothetical protein VGY55_11765 [Pirellulales bacterium]|jgi:hypothetical protein|nr:hypothetical protein [Pirellulales bacterium]